MLLDQKLELSIHKTCEITSVQICNDCWIVLPCMEEDFNQNLAEQLSVVYVIPERSLTDNRFTGWYIDACEYLVKEGKKYGKQNLYDHSSQEFDEWMKNNNFKLNKAIYFYQQDDIPSCDEIGTTLSELYQFLEDTNQLEMWK
ncbi:MULTISPECIES: hypothetical protein [unclassified Acinetobacter]|uniref:hypothetical protein n=1 Tax=unclassified Acinetobacter TaxID=196816 RepID=UPI001C23B304|nr:MULTISPECIES: hypothetical protein [unclassified Acinetobacter]